MSFYLAENSREILRLLRRNPELAPNSCLIQDRQKASHLRRGAISGPVYYFLFAAADEQGYARIIDVDVTGFENQQVAVLDILFPRRLSEHLADLAESVSERDYDRFFLNYEVSWVARRFSEASPISADVTLPETPHLVHFQGGNGQYSLIDLLSQDF